MAEIANQLYSERPIPSFSNCHNCYICGGSNHSKLIDLDSLLKGNYYNEVSIVGHKRFSGKISSDFTRSSVLRLLRTNKQ